jgi:hypothetical protein
MPFRNEARVDSRFFVRTLAVEVLTFVIVVFGRQIRLAAAESEGTP